MEIITVRHAAAVVKHDKNRFADPYFTPYSLAVRACLV
jgi:hypothetical protein